MSENVKKAPMTGKVHLDLSDLGLGSGPWPCTVVMDRLACPERLDIRFPMDVVWNGFLTQDREIVRGRPATVVLNDGSTLETKIQLFATWHGDMVKDGQLCEEIAGMFHLGQSVWHKTKSNFVDLWRFDLTNVKLNHADYVTEYGSGNARRDSLNVVRFRVEGREWSLIDDFSWKWKTVDKVEMAHPLLTARLETVHKDGDTRETLEAMATDIEALLRLALSRAVTWVSSARLAAGKVLDEHYRGAWTAPFRISSWPINDGFDTGQLKSLIETAYTKYSSDRKWFCNSIILYLVSLLGSHLEIRMSLQNTLLERIAAKVLEEDEAAEIDDDLHSRIDRRFKDRLHNLLSELSPRWARGHTGRLIEAIHGWNENPSFPGGVERAAERLGLWPPEKGQLAKRHKLIHRGEYDASDGMSVYDYWKGVECLVVMMLLRTLGYLGPFYHVAFGSSPVELKDYMQAGGNRPPYVVQKPSESTEKG